MQAYCVDKYMKECKVLTYNSNGSQISSVDINTTVYSVSLLGLSRGILDLMSREVLQNMTLLF